MMSFAFLRKALGIKKGADEKEFCEFLRHFDSGDISASHQLSRNIKKRSFRFVILRDEDRKVIFDSNSSKDSVKTLSIGSRRLNLFDIVFGSHVLATSKELLFSIKVHDLSSYGYVLISRVITDIDEWSATKVYGRRQCIKIRNCASSVPQIISRSETTKSVAACLIINVDVIANPTVTQATRGSSSSVISQIKRNSSVFIADERQLGGLASSSHRQSGSCAKRFYCMLFEHSTQLSVLVESLVDSTLSIICRAGRGHWSSSASMSEAIEKTYSQFLPSFHDLFSSKLHFPLWTTLNNILYNASDSITTLVIENPQLPVPASSVGSSTDFLVNAESRDTSLMEVYDDFTTLFLRHCLSPLLSRGKESRYFLCQLVTGILTLYPGWVLNLANTQFHQNSYTVPITPLHSSGCSSTPNMLLDQLLTQAGCLNLNLESLGGAIFNCTVLSGQSQKYLLALLYFATYFLRFPSLSSSNESVPDLGKVDLFELEHTRRRSRMNSKTRRKSGSAVSIGGDAPDSGISSQEDLTASLHSSSTGSSPTHTSGMALCMPQLLTRYQCRLAEVAAQLTVAREANAAAAAAMNNSTLQPAGLSIGPCASVVGTSTRLPTEALYVLENSNTTVGLGVGSSSQHRYTEIPLLIEKFVDEPCDQCSCVSTELFPSQTISPSGNTSFPSLPSNFNPTSPIGNPRFSFRAIYDSTPALPTGLSSSQISSPSSPRTTATLAGTGLASQASELARGIGCTPLSSTPTASDLAYRSFEQPATHSVTNHNLIGATVSEHFTTGSVLQATIEQADIFRERLEDQLNRWLCLGPLIVRGMNLSTRKMSHDDDQQGGYRAVSRRTHGHGSQWHACGLLANTDSKTVEVLTLSQKDPPTSTDPLPPGVRFTQRSTRHSFSQSTNMWSGSGLEVGLREPPSGSNRRSSATTDKPHPVPIRSAPLVTRLIDQTYLVFERTNCASMALRDLESGLQLFYHKSRVLADLLSHVGPSLLQQPERMTAAASCSVDDLPLLLSTAASYSIPAATILHSHFNEWWFC